MTIRVGWVLFVGLKAHASTVRYNHLT